MKSVIKERFKELKEFVDRVIMCEVYVDYPKKSSKILRCNERMGVEKSEGYDYGLIKTVYDILKDLFCDKEIDNVSICKNDALAEVEDFVTELEDSFKLFKDSDIQIDNFYPHILDINNERIAFWYEDFNPSKDKSYGKVYIGKGFDYGSFLNKLIEEKKIDTIVSVVNPREEQKQFIDFINGKLAKGKVVFLFDFLKEKLLESDYKYFCKCINDVQEHIDMLNSPEGIKYIASNNELIMKLQLKVLMEYLLDNNIIYNTNMDYFCNYVDDLDISNEYNLNWFTSIMSSQWAYIHIGYLPYLDNTSIVSGYLKSMEQLLLNLIDEDCKNNNYRAIYDDKVINVENSNKFMLGDLIDYISESKRFITNKDFRDEVLSLLYPWKNKSRNGYFHKDILTSKEKIESIRKNTLLITYILIVYFESGKEVCEKIDPEHFVF